MDSESPKYDIAVVLVGLNARDYIKGCLESLAGADWRNYTHQVVYVDNGSSDDSIQMVRELFPTVQVLANDSNLGYCPAANQGARLADARFLLFLNDDTVVLDDAIPTLADFLERQADAGSVGSRLFYADMREQWSGRSFPSPLNALIGRRSLLHRLFPNAPPVVKYLKKRELQGDVPFPVDWVSAAAVMFKAEPFHSVGGFTEEYYYWHEIIIADRLRRAGWKTYLHPLSRIIHYEGKGSGHRPYEVQRFHIIDFHRGAYRVYMEHYQLSKYNPLTWMVGAGLWMRAFFMLTGLRLASLFRSG